MQRLTRFCAQIKWLRFGCARPKLLAIASTTFTLSLLGCNAQSSSALYASLPPCADSYCDCSDFVSQAVAQKVLDAFEEDYFSLDQDGNGQACESLPQQGLSLAQATYFSNSEHLSFGNLSNASPDNPDNFLIERAPYTLAYSKSRNVLMWASWRVDQRWLGSVDRQDNFRPDGGLPKGFYQATPGDYRRSGYDRGHMVPSGDRTATERDNSLTFLMSNIFPQTSETNRGPWSELEQYGRELTRSQDKSVYVMAGIYGDKGKVGSKAGKVTVPSRIWKVIVVLDDAQDDINRRTEVIAVDMPNSDRIEADWQAYRTTIDRIEIATGYDLLSEIPEDIQSAVESR